MKIIRNFICFENYCKTIFINFVHIEIQGRKEKGENRSEEKNKGEEEKRREKVKKREMVKNSRNVLRKNEKKYRMISYILCICVCISDL